MVKFLIISLFLTATSVYSQWQWCSPQLTGNFIHGITFINKTTGFLVGVRGTILILLMGVTPGKLQKLIHQTGLHLLLLLTKTQDI